MSCGAQRQYHVFTHWTIVTLLSICHNISKWQPYLSTLFANAASALLCRFTETTTDFNIVTDSHAYCVENEAYYDILLSSHGRQFLNGRKGNYRSKVIGSHKLPHTVARKVQGTYSHAVHLAVLSQYSSYLILLIMLI